jgi:DNA-binding NarL/FixJ family response regulator
MNNQAPLTIALADDHALIRQALGFRLSKMGYKVVMEAENGKELIDQLEAAQTPHLCMLDINMPIMNGFETAIALKKKYPGVKIVFFSMQNGSSYINKAKEIGADGFICKNASSREFSETLQQLLPEQMEMALA